MADKISCAEVRKAIRDYDRNNYERPSVIIASMSVSHGLLADKEADEYMELYQDDHRVIGHKFDGIPLVSLNNAEGYELLSREEHRDRITKEYFKL